MNHATAMAIVDEAWDYRVRGKSPDDGDKQTFDPTDPGRAALKRATTDRAVSASTNDKNLRERDDGGGQP